MDHPETHFETISIVFLSNLHKIEALRLLEGVQPILQPAEMSVSYTATLLSFSWLYLQPAKILVSYIATLLSFFLAVFTTCQNVAWLQPL